MRGKNIVTINGRHYDAISGMPIIGNLAESASHASTGQTRKSFFSKGKLSSKHSASASPAKILSDITPQKEHLSADTQAVVVSDKKERAARVAAAHAYRKTQRSQTLQRNGLDRPATKQATRRSEMIQKYAHHGNAAAPKKHTHVRNTVSANKATSAQLLTKKVQSPPKMVTGQEAELAAVPVAQKVASAPMRHGRELKEHLITTRMEQIGQEATHHNQHPRAASPIRMRSVVATIAVVMILGGYLTYLNLPGLSIRVAATRADVNASYPSYRPSGYTFAGPVQFSPGKVSVNFKSNTNDYGYKLTQISSNWNSQAVLSNYILPETDRYATLQESGLTIFVMPKKAAWVNGGTLYVIDGSAPLSSEQIQKIASSTL